ncbi:MAG: universal stress protein [Alphaproteobacteria bacterium]|nr:universal stress protein [Alphaproteobacteria bacterium]
MKRILVATDGSEGAGRAVDYAASLAKDTKAELIIANVIGGYGLPGGVVRQFTHAQNVWFDELLASASAEILANARDRAVALGAGSVQLESRTGEVTKALFEIVKERKVDLIVAGRRGAGTLERLLQGSVSQKLSGLSPVPVIVIP